jgi:hypothetical protein
MNALEVEKVSCDRDRPPDAESIVEVRLLLESGLLTSLEAAARGQGVTAARLVRRLIRDFVYDADALKS